MFLVVAKKSWSFFSFSCSGNKQVCRSWEGAQPGSQPKLASGNISYHGHHAQFINGSWPGGQESPLFLRVQTLPRVWSFSVSLASSAKFVNSAKSTTFVSSGKPTGSVIAAWGVATQLVIGW